MTTTYGGTLVRRLSQLDALEAEAGHIMREVAGEFDRSLSAGLACGWRARASIWRMPPYPSPGEFALERLELEVWWGLGAGRRTLAMSSYRRHALTPEEAAQMVAAP